MVNEIDKVQIDDKSIVEENELNSTGLAGSPFNSISIVSIVGATKTITILGDVNEPRIQEDDIVKIVSGTALGIYAVNTIISDTVFTVKETILDSTSGDIEVYYRSGARITGFDPSNSEITAENSEEAIKQAALLGPVVGNLSKMFQGIDTVGGMQINNTAQVIPYDDVTLKDSYFVHSTTINSGEVEFTHEGWFKFTAITTIETIDASGGVRGNPRLNIQINDGSGWVTQPDNMGGYIRENSAGKLACSITGVGIFYMQVGWKMRIVCYDSITSEPNEATVPHSSRLLIEFKDRTGSASGSVDNISDIGDLEANAPNDGEVLVYDGPTSTWISSTIPSSTVDYINDIGDVNTGTPTNRDALVWDSVTSKWIAGSSVGIQTFPFELHYVSGTGSYTTMNNGSFFRVRPGTFSSGSYSGYPSCFPLQMPFACKLKSIVLTFRTASFDWNATSGPILMELESRIHYYNGSDVKNRVLMQFGDWNYSSTGTDTWRFELFQEDTGNDGFSYISGVEEFSYGEMVGVRFVKAPSGSGDRRVNSIVDIVMKLNYEEVV